MGGYGLTQQRFFLAFGFASVPLQGFSNPRHRQIFSVNALISRRMTRQEYWCQPKK
jgi:hypothetical protein